MAVRSIRAARPAARFDDVPYTLAIVQEAPTPTGTATDLDEFVRAPDADPSLPAAQSLTVTNATSFETYLRVRFEDADGNYSLTDWIGPGGYPSTEDLVDASTSAALIALSPESQDAKRRIAITSVERFCGQKFTSRVATRAIDGSGGTELWLPERLEAITAISVAGTAIDLTDVTLDADGYDRLHFAPLAADYATVAMRETAIDSRTFRTGAGRIVITGTWGWSVVPDAVVEALRLEMEAEASAQSSALAPIVASARRLGMATVTQGNLRVQVGDPSFVTPESARLLADYVWLPAGTVV